MKFSMFESSGFVEKLVMVAKAAKAFHQAKYEGLTRQMTVQYQIFLKNIVLHIATYLFTIWIIYLIIQRVGIVTVFAKLD